MVYAFKKKKRIEQNKDSMKGSLIGPSFSNEDIKKSLDKLMTKYIQMEKPKLVRFIAEKFPKEKLLDGFKIEWNLVQEHWALDLLLQTQETN